jgi:hypothetical protein
VQRAVQPGGTVPGVDVHREVEKPGAGFYVAVVAQRVADGRLIAGH